MLGDAAATAELMTEQTGQRCEPDGAADESAQKWNCAPRKSIPKSTAKRRTREVSDSI